MAQLKIRLRFNPGREGAPMDKLGEFSSQMERFLRSLAHDLGISAKKGEWLSRNFSNESVGFDAEYAGEVPDDVAIRGRHAFEHLGSATPIEACNQGFVSFNTMAQFSRIGETIDPDEKFLLGIYENGEDVPSPDQWREITYKRIAQVRQLLDVPFITYGSVQGAFYAWHSGAPSPFFKLRELSTGELITCNYEKSLYQEIHNATERPNAVLHVYGDIKWDRSTNSIIEVFAKKIDVESPLTQAEFNNLFGSMPEFTGEFSTSEYIEWLRGGGE